MKTFFDKYGNGSNEPYHALELIIDKLFKVKEQVERGDNNIFQELGTVSNMLDDFAQQAKTTEFKPRKYSDVQGHPQGFRNEYGGEIGYKQPANHFPFIYPIYPLFDADGQNPRRRSRLEEVDYPNPAEVYRRNLNRPNDY